MENEKNLNQNDENKNVDLNVFDIMIKQQSLLLQQFEVLSHEREKAHEKEDEIDLTRLVPRFLKKKKTNKDGSDFEVLSTESLSQAGAYIKDKVSDIDLSGIKENVKKTAKGVKDYIENIDTTNINDESKDVLENIKNYLNDESKDVKSYIEEIDTTGMSEGAKDTVAGINNYVSTAAKEVAKGANIASLYIYDKGFKTALLFKKMLQTTWITILLSLIGLGYGINIYFTGDKQYESDMTISSGKMTNTFYSGLIFKLERLVELDGFDELSSKLNISVEDAEKISSITYADYLYYDILEDENLLKDSTQTITVTERPFFRIEAKVTDVSIFPQLQAGIEQYLRNNPFAVRDRDVRKLILRTQIEKFTGEMRGMDSLKYAVINRISKKNNETYQVNESALQNGQGIILSQDDKLEIDPLIPFERTLAYSRQINNYEKELIQIDREFEVIDGFAGTSQHVFPRVKHMLIFLIYGLILGGALNLFFGLVLFRIRLVEIRKEQAEQA